MVYVGTERAANLPRRRSSARIIEFHLGGLGSPNFTRTAWNRGSEWKASYSGHR